jgi:hypothetical protein
VNERELWGIFFEQIYAVGIWSIHSMGYISFEEVDNQEPFLFIGLPSVSLLNMVLRGSLNSPESVHELRLIDGRSIKEESCPPSYRIMFRILTKSKQDISQLSPKIQPEEIDWVREWLLYSSSDKPLKNGDRGISVERQKILRRLFSALVEVSTQLTQQSFYKENFLAVLEKLVSGVPS